METLLLAVATLGLAVVVAIACGALVEVFRQLAEIRPLLDLDDQPLSLDFRGSSFNPAHFGFSSAIAAAPEAMVVFLSTKCATCLAIAESFRGGAPASVWFVVQSDDPESNLAAILSASRGRLAIDVDGRRTTEMGLDVTPSVLTLRFGDVIRAQAVSSPRQVLTLIPVLTTATATNGAPELAVDGDVCEVVGKNSDQA